MTHLLDHFRLLTAPGLHNSGPAHWQSRWERLYPHAERVRQDHWSTPDLPAWSRRVHEVRQQDRRPTLILAHSFGCLASVHSLAQDPADVAGLLLVAPADPAKFGVAGELPHHALPVPSIVIASTNDPWMRLPDAAIWAERWGAEFVNAGALGHINSDSNLGDWPLGQRYLLALAGRALRTANA